MNFFEKVKFWYSNSRPYSIPITFLSWLVAFCYALNNGGNALCGVIALVGISLVHLATNLSDDYFDYKRLCTDESFLNNSKNIKCRYLRDNLATVEDLKRVIIGFLSVAALCGVILFFLSGWMVICFALCVLPIALFYSHLSSKGLGDVAVILAYGPLLFEGVYYVMTKSLSFDVLILSLGCAMFVNTILYAHMLMDFDEDVISKKITTCTIWKDKDLALIFISFFYISGYVFISLMSLRTNNYLYFITFMTIPMVFEAYKYLEQYNHDKTSLFEVKFWHYPIENWDKVKDSENAPFLQRFMYVRNISTWFMLLTCFSIFLVVK